MCIRDRRKNFDIQRNTRVASGGQFTLNSIHLVIPDNCQVWDTIALFRLVKVHQKLRKFETNSPNWPKFCGLCAKKKRNSMYLSSICLGRTATPEIILNQVKEAIVIRNKHSTDRIDASDDLMGLVLTPV